MPLELRESARARRMTLRVDAGRGLIQVVIPVGVPEAEALRFVGRHDGWVRARLAALPPQLPFTHGAVVPYLGIDQSSGTPRTCAGRPGARTARSWSAAGRSMSPAGCATS
ncbi:hypothetical protein [Azospirillum brasilense]|uniref:hypothetical protein n=1 Tax=Azospirillum brasilense TaxID=192 RepID=UPI0003A98366